jgi:hypothetical protein
MPLEQTKPSHQTDSKSSPSPEKKMRVERGEQILNLLINEQGGTPVIQHILTGDLTKSQIQALADIVEHHPHLQKYPSPDRIRNWAILGDLLFSLHSGNTVDMHQLQQELEQSELTVFHLNILEHAIPAGHPQKVEIVRVIMHMKTLGTIN